MSKIHMVPLGDLVELIRNGLAVSNDSESGGLPITRIETIAGHRVDPHRVGFAGIREGEKEEWLLQHGDILFSHINSIPHLGKCALYDGLPSRLIHGMNLLLIRPRKILTCSRFLVRALRSVAFREQLARHVKPAVNQASVSISALRTIAVPFLPFHEQYRIADVLDKAEAICRKRREALALTDELVRSTFLEMFGDPSINPLRWPNATLGELIEVKSGSFLPAKQMDSSGAFAVYGGNGIAGRHSEYMFADPVIVIGRVGAYCGVVHLTERRSWVTDNALYVSRREPSLQLRYLEHALRMLNLNRFASQVAQPLVSAGRIYPLYLPVPPIELQERFATCLLQAENSRDVYARASIEADMFFEAIQQRAFRGEL